LLTSARGRAPAATNSKGGYESLSLLDIRAAAHKSKKTPTKGLEAWEVDAPKTNKNDEVCRGKQGCWISFGMMQRERGRARGRDGASRPNERRLESST
jgi:hypothetical protein